MNLKRIKQSYTRVFEISLVLGFLYLYINYIREDSIWNKITRIHSQARSVLRMATFSERIALDDCDDDQFVDMEKYLQHRRRCILRHCGDVCKTNISSSKGKIFIGY